MASSTQNVDMDLIRRLAAEDLGHSQPKTNGHASKVEISAAVVAPPEPAAPVNNTVSEDIDDIFAIAQPTTSVNGQPAGQPVTEPYPTTLIGWALWCAKKGWRVFPCQEREKAPVTFNGVLDATTDTEAIKSWWSKNPNYNYGVAGGDASNLVIYDFDECTPEEFAAYSNQPETFEVRTGRALKPHFIPGTHRYFNGSCRNRILFAPAVEPITERQAIDKKTGELRFLDNGDPLIQSYDRYDRLVVGGRVPIGEIRSRGYYVCGVGSVHPSGQPYTIVRDVPLAVSPLQDVEEVHEYAVAESDTLESIAGYIESAFDESRINYKRDRLGYRGGVRWWIDCPWRYQHTNQKSIDDGNTSSSVIMAASGAIQYVCQHAHCLDTRQWKVEQGKESLREWMESKVGHKLRFQDDTSSVITHGGVLPEHLQSNDDDFVSATGMADLILKLGKEGKAPEEVAELSGFNKLVEESLAKTAAETAKAEAVVVAIEASKIPLWDLATPFCDIDDTPMEWIITARIVVA
jgi:hypothetical protein